MDDEERIDSRTRNLVLPIILVVIAILIGLMLVPFTIRRKLAEPYRQFVNHDTNYFAQVARACDLLLLQNPLGTNDAKIIPASDPTIPQFLQNLHPSYIDITSKPTRVSFVVGHGRTSFGVAWEQRVTNTWSLYLHSQDSENIVYSETRSAP